MHVTKRHIYYYSSTVDQSKSEERQGFPLSMLDGKFCVGCYADKMVESEKNVGSIALWMFGSALSLRDPGRHGILLSAFWAMEPNYTILVLRNAR